MLVRLMADKKKVKEDEDQKVDSGVPLMGPSNEGHSERKVVVIVMNRRRPKGKPKKLVGMVFTLSLST